MTKQQLLALLREAYKCGAEDYARGDYFRLGFTKSVERTNRVGDLEIPEISEIKTLSEVRSESKSNMEVSRKLGLNRATVERYIGDTAGKYHHVYNGRLFTAKGSPQ